MIQCSVLVWNVRGLNSAARRAAVTGVVQQKNVSVVCLQESKMNMVEAPIINDFCGPGFDHFAFTPSVGASGGVITACKDDILSVCASLCSPHFVSINCLQRSSGKQWQL